LEGLHPIKKYRRSFIYLTCSVRNLCQTYVFTGFFGIDFIYNPNNTFFDNPQKAFTIIELNPRITTPYIAYSQLFKQESKNMAEFFFKGDYIFQNNNLQYYGEYTKDEQNNEMKITLKRRK
jgi:predicted ATP-grasp superfamily ATP-dependent carboligase